LFLGRTHLYEGRGVEPVVHGVRTAAAAGVKTVILTNAAGGLAPDHRVGQAVIIRDHLNLTARSPLVGADFVDLTDLYSARLRALCREVDPSLPEGVYAQFPGPQYETPAEVRMARVLGAQLATGSVGGAVTCLVMVIAHLLTLRATRIERIVLSLSAIVLVVYLAATSGVGSQRLAEYIGPQANPFSTSNSLGWRFEAWAKVLAVWREHPFFGNGAGATRAGVILGNIPHNEYVRLLAEMGVFGLALVLAVCLAYGLRMLKALHRSTDFGPSLALAVLAGSLVNGIAANTMLYSVSFYTTIFILTGCWRADRDAQREEAAAAAAGGPESAGRDDGVAGPPVRRAVEAGP